MKFKTKSLILIVLLIALLVLFGTNSSAAQSFRIDNISAIVDNTNAKIQWTEAEGATGYEVYVELPAVGYQYIGTVTSNEVQIIGFEHGTTYGVKVRAYKGNGANTTYSGFSQEVKFKYGESTKTTSSLGTIGKIEAISYGTTGSLKWDKVDNADGYQILAKVGNGNFIDMGTTTSTELKVIGMDRKRVYTIKIRPYMDVAGERVFGTFSETAILKFEDSTQEEIKIDTVNNFNISTNNSKAYLTWNKVNGADGYEVLVEMPEGTEAVYNVERNNLTLQNFTAGYTYKAKVRAYKYADGKKVYGNYSNTKNIKIEKIEEEIKLDTVTNLNISLNGQTAKITWNRVNGASGYEIEIDDPDRGNIITTTTTTNKTISGFKNNKENYAIRVRAYKNADGKKVYGNYSNKKYFKGEKIEEKPDEPGKVTGVDVDINDDEVRITWDRVSGADGYELKVYEPGEGYSTYRITSRSKTLYNLDYSNTRYFVQVRAYINANGERIYGDYSSKKYFRIEKEELDKVTDVKINVDGEKAKITWDRVSGADGYELRIYEPDEGYYTIRTSSTSKTLYNVEYSSSKYSVQIRAYENVDGRRKYGEYSTKKYFRGEKDVEEEHEKQEDTKKVPSQVNGLKVTRNGNNVKFSWNKASNASGYQVKMYERGIATYSSNVTGTSKTVIGVPATTTYTVKVRAYTYVNGKIVYGPYSVSKTFN